MQRADRLCKDWYRPLDFDQTLRGEFPIYCVFHLLIHQIADFGRVFRLAPVCTF